MSDPTEEIKIACPHCGQHILIEASMLGTELQCPACNQPFEVPEAGVAESEVPVAQPQGEEAGGVRPSIRRYGKVKIGMFRLKSSFAFAWRRVKSAFLRIPERIQGAVLAAVVIIVLIGFFCGKDESRDSKNSTPPESSATEIKSPPPRLDINPRLDIKPLSADPTAGQWILSCQKGDFKDVMRYPERYEGTPLFIQGKILKVFSPENHRGEVRILQDGDWKRDWVVIYDDERTSLPNGNLLEDDNVCVFGTFEKIWEWTGKNAFNATVSGKNPGIIARLISTDDPDDVAKSFAGEDGAEDDGAGENRTDEEGNHSDYREPTAVEKTFKEGLDALRGENDQKRDIVKAYRLFQQAEKEGYILGEVGIAHICWTMTDDERRALTNIGITPPLSYFYNWRHAAKIGKSKIAKCEFGLFHLQREAWNEGLKLLRDAAAEGSNTAAMFLRSVAEQKDRSSLPYEIILEIFTKNSNSMALIQKSCEVELVLEYLSSLERQP